MVEEDQRGGRDGRRGEYGDHRAEEGRGEDARRRSEEEGEGRRGGGREDSAEEGRVVEEA